MTTFGATRSSPERLLLKALCTLMYDVPVGPHAALRLRETHEGGWLACLPAAAPTFVILTVDADTCYKSLVLPVSDVDEEGRG